MTAEQPTAATSAPAWPAAGETVHVVRRSLMGRVDHERTATVARRTPARVITDDGDRFKLVDGRWTETPRYLDYTTVLEPTGETDA